MIVLRLSLPRRLGFMKSSDREGVAWTPYANLTKFAFLVGLQPSSL